MRRRTGRRGIFWRGIPSEVFEDDRYAIRLTSVEENEENIRLIVDLVRSVNPSAPIVLTLILGPLMERSLRQSLEISQGSFLVFLQSPIAVTFLAVTALVLIAPAFRFFRQGKEVMAGEEAA